MTDSLELRGRSDVLVRDAEQVAFPPKRHIYRDYGDPPTPVGAKALCGHIKRTPTQPPALRDAQLPECIDCARPIKECSCKSVLRCSCGLPAQVCVCRYGPSQ